MSGDQGWAPLLDPVRQRQALDAARDIVAGVVECEGGDGASSAAAAMSLAYAARVELVADAEALAAERLDATVAALSDGVTGVGLWGGLAGVGFSVSHLAGGDDAAAVCQVIDEALLQHLDIRSAGTPGSPWTGDYDLVGGLVGIGISALERLEAPDARRVATRVLEHLENTAREEGGGVTWFTPPALLPEWQRALCPDGHYNLGLAHGVPGVIGLMAGFVTAELEVPRARALLDGAVRWLRALVPARPAPRFPAWWGPGIDEAPARLAWCYGDAGVAITLLAAARALEDAGLEEEAIAMGHEMAARPIGECGVVDMAICHGAAGVAHIFNRMYQATGDAVLGDAARTWIDRMLAMRRPGEAIGGFPALRSRDGADSWEAEAGIISGASGVALVLLAAATEIEPAWDRSLLVDGGSR